MSYEIKTGYIVYTTDGGHMGYRMEGTDAFYGPNDLAAAEADAKQPYRSMQKIDFIEVDGVRFRLDSTTPLRTKIEISLERARLAEKLAQAAKTLKASGFSEDEIARLLANP